MRTLRRTIIALALVLGTLPAGSKVVEVTEAGTLGSLLTDDEKDNATSLTVIGNLNSDDISVLKYMSSQGKLADLDIYGTSIQTIEKAAFSDCNSLTSIVLPYEVKTIEQNAFKGCNYLTSIVFPAGLTSIGDNSFDGCNHLTSVVLPEGLKSIGNSSFRLCSSLSSIELPASLSIIGVAAFQGCSSLITIKIPAGITSIGNNTFYGCSSLISINLTVGVTSIGELAFSGCNSLTSIEIPVSVTYIGVETFNDCSSLTSIVLPDGLTSIGQYAFNACSSLTSIDIPAGVTKIEEGAFKGCSSLTSVVIPVGVTSIGFDAFSFCSSLTSIVLPDGLKSIGGSAFYGCSSLTSIIIPDGITNIDNKTFRDCSSLKSIFLPDGLTRIGNYAFAYCSSLSSISIPDCVTSIGIEAFSNCSLKKCIVRGDKVVDYRDYGDLIKYSCLFFVDNGLYDKYMENLDWAAYSAYIISADMLKQKTVELIADEGSSSLFTLLGDSSVYTGNLKIKGTINGYDIMTLRNKTFHLINLDLSEASIVANDGGYEYYTGYSLKAANELGDHSFADLILNEVVLPKTLESIGNDAFSGCKYLESAVIQDGLISIGNYAFSNCSLKEIYLPGSLIEIGSGAFENCSVLSGVLRIPDKITEVKTGTFSLTGIDTLIIGQNVIIIDGAAFSNCRSLKSIVFNRKLQTLGSYSFAGCVNLMAANLPYTVENIGFDAFRNCYGLESIKIPSMTKRIGDNAFGGCSNLRNIYTYTVEPTEINQQTFSSYKYATLHVPKTSANIYKYNTQWSQFAFVHEFDEPYEAFYLNGDVELDDETGRMSGEPDAEMYETSGFIIEGDATQELSAIELSHNGTNGASIISSAGQVGGTAANLTAKSMNVNITVEGNRWYFFCFPFNVELDSVECTSQHIFYSYDGIKRATNDTGWKKLADDEKVLQKGSGYIFQASKTGILTVHVNKDYLTFAANNESELLHAYESDDVSNASWNFLGNPFISYYDVQDLAREYDAPIIVWNGRGYDAFKPGDDDYQLKPFEAFFVQKPNGKSVVEFLPENRITYNKAQELKQLRANRRAKLGTEINPERLLVNITLMDCDSVTDRTRIVYSTKASMDYEIGVDAAKFHSDGAPQIYSLAGGTRYAINERSMGGDDIKLGYIAPKAGTYILAVPRQDAEIEIYDNVAQAVVDFTFGDYMFETQAGTYNDRFVIRKTGGVTAVENGFRLDGLTVTTFDGGLDIEGSMKGKVSIYNEAGMLLAEPRQTGKLELDGGVYIVKVADKSVKIAVE